MPLSPKALVARAGRTVLSRIPSLPRAIRLPGTTPRVRPPIRFDDERSALSARTLRDIQDATIHRYQFKGVRCQKDPFDLALYSMLISRERPRTIVEIGSSSGGSALWFAALVRGLELDCKIWSLDINKVTDVADPLVTFMQGDIHDLAASDLDAVLRDCPRPLMVIEDGPHTFEGCRAAMEYFDGFMREGEYLIIEDGILKDLGYDSLANGPNRAVKEFIARRGADYVIDREWCDFFGRNVTWNPNGYLRRIGP